MNTTKRKVLSVGQCALDHSNISRLLMDHFDVEVQVADSHDDVLRKVRKSLFDLILINRIYDLAGTEGIATIRSLRSGTEPVTTPVMLVSNFEDAQVEAIKAGAVRGFGKSALAEKQTIELLNPYLG